VRRGESQQLGRAVDEAMQRLRELARRQEQEVERQRRSTTGSPGAQGGGDRGQQRRLAEEAQELGRRLERLAREQQAPGLQETANRLKQAADSMRRAGAGGGNGGLSQGLSALERLKDARRTLEQSREDHARQDIERTVDLAEGIARDQGQIADEVRRLGDGQGEDARERVQRLHERKDALAAQVQSLEEQLDRMAGDTRTSDAQASRALREAATGIRENKLKEKIRYSKGVVRGRPGGTRHLLQRHALAPARHVVPVLPLLVRQGEGRRPLEIRGQGGQDGAGRGGDRRASVVADLREGGLRPRVQGRARRQPAHEAVEEPATGERPHHRLRSTSPCSHRRG